MRRAFDHGEAVDGIRNELRYKSKAEGLGSNRNPTAACGGIGGVELAVASRAGAALRSTLEPIRAFAWQKGRVRAFCATGSCAERFTNKKSTP